jgi:ADP-heptose:LPS heptosyltransferase
MKWRIGVKMLGFEKTYILPFKFDIPNYTKEFLDKKTFIKPWIKFIKRYIYIHFKGQNSLEIYNILPEYKEILWINISAPSLGDSLMDLSSRTMLKDRKVDLFTDKKNSNLYKDDFLFSKVFNDIKQLGECRYDLVVLDSYSTRSIDIKLKIARLTPFVGMFGYYNGPEVNRVLFSFHQMNNLLGYVKNENELNKIARTSISISIDDQKLIKKLELPSNFIAIAIGGEWDYRTYKNWRKVIEILFLKDKSLQIILLGSDNAKETEKEILEYFSTSHLVSYVSNLTFNQTGEIIRQANVLLCCDGGLMHVANALDTRIIPLFARLTADMQLTKSCRSLPLFDSTDVNNISVEDIILKYNEAVNF